MLVDRAFGGRIADFGIAAHGAAGTPLWMAPERLAAAAAAGGGSGGCTAAGDVWAYGVVIYEVSHAAHSFPRLSRGPQSQGPSPLSNGSGRCSRHV